MIKLYEKVQSNVSTKIASGETKAFQEFKTKIQFTGNQPSNSETKDSTIFQYTFSLMDPKIFQKAPLAPISTNFEGAVRRKNAIFWSKFSKNCPKRFLACFFSKCSLRRRKLGHNWNQAVLGECSEN